jgi:hypothetical protein
MFRQQARHPESNTWAIPHRPVNRVMLAGELFEPNRAYPMKSFETWKNVDIVWRESALMAGDIRASGFILKPTSSTAEVKPVKTVWQ